MSGKKMRAQPIEVPKELTRRPAIDDCLKHPAEAGLYEQAMNEYLELLTIENMLVKEDLKKYRLVCARNKKKSVSDYIKFSEDLLSQNPNSKLLQHICGVFKKKKSSNSQTAMKDWLTLKDISTGYQGVKSRSTPRVEIVENKSKNHLTDVRDARSYNHFPPDQPVKLNEQTFYPEAMYKELERRSCQQSDDITMLQKKLAASSKQVDELTTRISSFASKQLTQGNPTFTDLSDQNRPLKIAEKFHHIYDDEWTTALEALTHVKKGSDPKHEEQVITLLADIIKSANEFCVDYARKQADNLKKTWKQCLNNPFCSAFNVEQETPQLNPNMPSETVVLEFLNDRRSVFSECVKAAIQNFNEKILPRIQKNVHPSVKAYSEKCIEALWLMSIQSPPMVIRWATENYKFDATNFKEYCKKGTVVKLPVWPAVFLHDNGPLMNKGYAMPV